METKIKELRVKLDGLAQLTNNLNPEKVAIIRAYKNSKEIEKAVESLTLSKMWLGKVLKELGTSNPYPESKNPVNEQIEPTADTAKNLTVSIDGGWEEMSHIQKVKYLRTEIEKVELGLKEEELKYLATEIDFNTYLVRAIDCSTKYCIEAGMWLGMELGRIRDTK